MSRRKILVSNSTLFFAKHYVYILTKFAFVYDVKNRNDNRCVGRYIVISHKISRFHHHHISRKMSTRSLHSFLNCKRPTSTPAPQVIRPSCYRTSYAALVNPRLICSPCYMDQTFFYFNLATAIRLTIWIRKQKLKQGVQGWLAAARSACMGRCCIATQRSVNPDYSRGPLSCGDLLH